MENKIYTIFDIEANGLLDDVTKIHCLCYIKYQNGKILETGELVSLEDISKFITSQEILVGHNIILYDIPVLEKLLNIKISSYFIDTLALSWYLYDGRLKHGLEDWGEELGTQKPEIKDWENLTLEEYINRCKTDVEINFKLFLQQFSYLKELYDSNYPKIKEFIKYLSFKLDCIREQEEIKTLIDVDKVHTHLEELTKIRDEKVSILVEAMPKNIKYGIVNKPSKLYKKDGTLSRAGEKWFKLLEEHNLPEDYEEPIQIVISEEPGNPISSKQLKDWLFSLGWEPINYEERKNKSGEINTVPQIYNDKKQVCASIKKLYDIEPRLENLDMLSLIKHRIGVLQSFLDSVDNTNHVKASLRGLTSTLRLQHKKPLANLPKVGVFYGEEIRGCIISPKGYLGCGSDMSALEDTTKQHYMYYFDPKYVQEMRVPGFDPHLDIAQLANLLTKEQVEQHKKGEANYSKERSLAKTINFAGIYGAGPPKIASSTGMSLEEATKLHKTYWERNKAIKLVSDSFLIKVFFSNNTHKIYKSGELSKLIRNKTISEDTISSMWLQQPVSKFWYSLRYLKDCFSAANQSTGVFCFDLYIREMRKRGIKINFQYHDNIFVVNKSC